MIRLLFFLSWTVGVVVTAHVSPHAEDFMDSMFRSLRDSERATETEKLRSEIARLRGEIDFLRLDNQLLREKNQMLWNEQGEQPGWNKRNFR
jgi:hypothetical protein